MLGTPHRTAHKSRITHALAIEVTENLLVTRGLRCANQRVDRTHALAQVARPLAEQTPHVLELQLLDLGADGRVVLQVREQAQGHLHAVLQERIVNGGQLFLEQIAAHRTEQQIDLRAIRHRQARRIEPDAHRLRDSFGGGLA